MKHLIATVAIAVAFLVGVSSYCEAGEYVAGDFGTGVQSLGSRTRAMITSVSGHGADVDRPLRYQAQGDQALRRGDLIRAAEDYGRAEEAISVLDTQRVQARNARARTLREIEHARRHGTDIAQAEIEYQRGDQAMDNGDFVNAELHYAQARASLATQ
jgi:hypothetical protein